MPKLLNFKGGEKSFENLKAVIESNDLIAVICLGSSQDAGNCFQRLKKAIGDQQRTVLTHVSDDADAAKVKAELATLSGPDPKPATICTVVGHDQAVVGNVEPPKGFLAALALWLKAVENRGS